MEGEAQLVKRIVLRVLQGAVKAQKKADDELKTATAERDSAIRTCEKLGFTVEELAGVTGLAQSTIYGLLKNGEQWIDLGAALKEINAENERRDQMMHEFQRQLAEMQRVIEGGRPRRRPARGNLAAVKEARADGERPTGTGA